MIFKINLKFITDILPGYMFTSDIDDNVIFIYLGLINGDIVLNGINIYSSKHSIKHLLEHTDLFIFDRELVITTKNILIHTYTPIKRWKNLKLSKVNDKFKLNDNTNKYII
jgi:hypothetical protein